MEGFDDESMEGPSQRERFREFKEAIAPRLHDAAVSRQRTYQIRDVLAVEERLFDRFDGDASKVTDYDISKAYDEIDKN